MSQSFAPVVLFVYNRLDHTKQTIEALKNNDLASESILYIFSDAAKNQGAENDIISVRNYIHTIEGFKEVIIIERDKNFGLANSISEGVTDIVRKFGKVIVLEDDLVTSSLFLRYMNDALEKYKEKKEVFSITGYSWTDENDDIDDTYFLKLTSSWSWATWKDRWDYFSREEVQLEKALNEREFMKKFNYNNSYNYTKLARLQLNEKIDSWAIFWYFSVFQQNGLTLYPSKKLVKNIGHDGSGTHTHAKKEEELTIRSLPIMTENIFESAENRIYVQKILKKENFERTRIMFLAMIVAAIYLLFSKYGYKIVLILPLILPVAFLLSIYRHIRGDLFTNGIPSIDYIFKLFFNLIESQQFEISKMILAAVESINFNVIYGLFNKITIDNILYGGTLIKPLLIIIPRSVWTDKPVTITVQAAHIFAPYVEGLSLVTTIIGEIHMNFYIFGIFLMPFFLLLIEKLIIKIIPSSIVIGPISFMLAIMFFRLPFSDTLITVLMISIMIKYFNRNTPTRLT